MSEPTKMNRRKFLKTAGIGLGAVVLSCAGITTAATITPSVDFFETEETKMKNNRVLIAYASKAGSTGEVAQAMAKTLTAQGHAVDVHLVKTVKDLSPYSAVIVGSAIRTGQWLPEAVNFVRDHQATLQQLSTAFFTVCLTLHEDTEENRRKVAAYTDPVRAILQPNHEAFFAGKMDYSRLSLFDRLMANMVKAPEGDWRNWDEIRSWAGQAI